nr:LOW QUALITY PROTEIN: tyrosyl-DNA phosphodiesterase 2-like [Aegilops tauschii subsp. strangulata]
MATLLSRSPRRLLRFLKPQTLLSPTLTSSSPPHDLPARIPPPGWSASPQWQWHRHRALWTHSNPQNSGACDAGLAAAPGASSLPLRMRRGRAASTDVAEVSADKGVGANGAHQAAAKEETSVCSKAIKIMTYNVCFGQNMELHSRIPAIGDIIQHHSPDLICLQEVTPEIHGLLKKSDWWPEYNCLMPREMDMRSYFCMQMSKLPVDSFRGVPFPNSAMGRELSMANVSIGGVTLVLGTSHLESPRREAPWWDHDMNRNKRAAQAKASLEWLGGSRNAIFCGDMNWDDKIDGTFPLPDGWADAWAQLKPDEGGWTYDTVANAMLSKGYKKLQLSLDRFVCKLPDFEVQGIEMVGKEPMPGVSYEEVKEFSHKSKSGKKFSGTWEWMLPVLPSDHFGLVLTIAPRDGSSAPSE